MLNCLSGQVLGQKTIGNGLVKLLFASFVLYYNLYRAYINLGSGYLAVPSSSLTFTHCW